MIKVRFLNQVYCKSRVVSVGVLVLGLAQSLEGVRQSFQTSDQLVRPKIFGDLQKKD